MKKRVISAIVAAAIFIPIFLLGGVLFSLGVGIVAGLAYLEIINLKKDGYPGIVKALGLIGLELVVFNTILPNYNGINYLSLGFLTLILIIPSIFMKKYEAKDALQLMGFILLVGLMFSLILNVTSDNKWIFIYLLLIAIMTDTFAMITGALIGKHKLIPKVSPKKTVEGSVGGSILGTIVPSLFYYFVITKNINFLLLLLLTFVLSILGQLGDLFFSKIKREHDIKDYSNIMPGHGGILDRLDSLSFIIIGYIMIFYIIRFIV